MAVGIYPLIKRAIVQFGMLVWAKKKKDSEAYAVVRSGSV